MSEVRKRALDEDHSASQAGDQDPSLKRVAKEQELHSIESVMVMKVLCPTNIVGAIIGRGGAVLNGLQTESKAKIRVSQNNDFFPETNDRVIAITGQPECVTAGLAAVVEKMCEVTLANESKSGIIGPSDTPSNSNTVSIRLLIPHGASGVVIGRGGANIKEISTLTETRLQLADAADRFQTKERIVNITGSVGENMKNAAILIFDYLIANRNVGNFVNTTPSYLLPSTQQQLLQGGRPAVHVPPPTPSGQQYPSQHQPQPQPQQFVYPPSHAPQLATGLTISSSQHAHQPPYSSAPGQYYSGQSHAQPPSSQPPQGYPPNSSMPMQGTSVVTQIMVPDEMVGKVLGKGGAILKGIVGSTGARIKVSQKGDFVAGTTNRSITVEGTQEQVQFAQSAIMAQIGSQHSSY